MKFFNLSEEQTIDLSEQEIESDIVKVNSISITPFDMIVDVNGLKNPNSFGRDMFDFMYCKAPVNEAYFTQKDKYGLFLFSKEILTEICLLLSFLKKNEIVSDVLYTFLRSNILKLSSLFCAIENKGTINNKNTIKNLFIILSFSCSNFL